jgi:hypothetical protein
MQQIVAPYANLMLSSGAITVPDCGDFSVEQRLGVVDGYAHRRAGEEALGASQRISRRLKRQLAQGRL